MTALVSFHNDPHLKSAWVAEVVNYREQDRFVQGKPPSIEYNDHARFETDLGIPEWLARLVDTLFESLPSERAMFWPEQFARAVPVGVDLGPVRWHFCAMLMRENIARVLGLSIDESLKTEVVEAIRGVLALHETAIQTGHRDESAAWSAAWSAASAARSVARSAAWSAARSAWSAARSAAWLAWSLAGSAESAARSAESAARSAESAAWSLAGSAESAAGLAGSADSAVRSAGSAAWSAADSAVRSAADSAVRSAESAESAAYERYADALLEMIIATPVQS